MGGLQDVGFPVDDPHVTLAMPTWFDDDVVEHERPVGHDHVVVRLGGGRYAVAAADVAEVVAVPHCTRVPGTPPWVVGVANWRGHVLPVIDLRPLLGVGAGPLPTSARLVVVSVEDVEVGLVTEAVTGLLEAGDDLRTTPATLTGDASDLVAGVAEDGTSGPVAVLSTRAVLALSARVSRPAV